MPFIFHFFENSKLTDHSIYLNRGDLGCLPGNSDGIYVADNFPCSSLLCHCDKGFAISNINIIINFIMGFCKLDLGSREIVRHIYYIKSQLLGLISLIKRE